MSEISPQEFAEPSGTSFRDILVRATPRFWVTPVLIAANVLYFVFAVTRGVSPIQPGTEELHALGAIYGPSILDGEWWRLLTAAFVHIGFIHLAFNMWALWNLGNLAERMFGNLTFLLIYLVSAIGGSLASLLWHPANTSAGASGAVFGVLGALVAFLRVGRIDVPREVVRQLRSSLVFVVGFNLILGAALPGIDNAGHIGGLAVGLLSGAVLHRPLPSGRRSYRRYLLIPVLFLLFFLAGRIAVERGATVPEPIAAATSFDAEGPNAEAIEKLSRELELDPESVEGWTRLARLHLEGNRVGDAIAAFERAVGLSPESAPLETELGSAYARAERYQDAIGAYEKAIALDPQIYQPRREIAIALVLAGREEEAIDAFRAAKQIEPSDLGNHVGLSYVLSNADRTEEALEVLEEARKLDPESAEVESALGLVRLRRGETAQAVSALQKAAEREPYVAEHHNRLSLALAKANDPGASLRAIQKAMDLAPPGSPHLLDSLGTVHLYRGEPLSAADAYRRAIALAPDEAIYHFNLSIALARQGRREEGELERAEAMRLDPDLETPPDGQPII